jgi:hypothetical protein
MGYNMGFVYPNGVKGVVLVCIFKKYECSKVHTIIQQFQAPCHPFLTAGSVA